MITSAKNGSGEQILQLKTDNVYKGTVDQEITIHSRNITFEENKTYIVFLGIIDLTTIDSAIYFPIADCAWDILGYSLDYVHESFSEMRRITNKIWTS